VPVKIFTLMLFFFYHASANDKSELIIHNEPKNILINDLFDSEGSVINILEQNKDFIILNFWATWCAPCVKEIPDLLKVQRTYKNKYKIFFVSVGFTPVKDVEKFVDKNSFNEMNILFDNDLKFSKDIKVKNIPSTIILNNEGKEVVRVLGYIDWNNDRNKMILEEL